MSRYDTETWKQLVTIQDLMPHIDILTITGFMDDTDLEAHLERYKHILEDQD